MAVFLFSLAPINGIASNEENISWISAFSTTTPEAAEAQLTQLYVEIGNNPQDANLYLKRGIVYLGIHRFIEAIMDFDTAIEEGDLDQAYYGRGLAKGRIQEFDEAIADMSTYIQRHPKSSLAYTKRGIRHLWKGSRDNAKQDFITAIALDPGNAEANDDLGVIYAQEENYEEAIKHFVQTINLEPSYQKAYHNLSMTYFLTGQDFLALSVADKSLELRPTARDSMLLKAAILTSLGMTEQAESLREDAEFLGHGNWSERIPVQ